MKFTDQNTVIGWLLLAPIIIVLWAACIFQAVTFIYAVIETINSIIYY